jgi:hypothetical protein
MNENADILGLEAGLAKHQPNALDDASFGRAGSSENLAAPAPRVGLKHNIGESAANVGCEFDGAGFRHKTIMSVTFELARPPIY